MGSDCERFRTRLTTSLSLPIRHLFGLTQLDSLGVAPGLSGLFDGSKNPEATDSDLPVGFFLPLVAVRHVAFSLPHSYDTDFLTRLTAWFACIFVAAGAITDPVPGRTDQYQPDNQGPPSGPGHLSNKLGIPEFDPGEHYRDGTEHQYYCQS